MTKKPVGVPAWFCPKCGSQVNLLGNCPWEPHKVKRAHPPLRNPKPKKETKRG